MGFADGFQAGSGMVMRGLQMRDAREQRERENAFVDEQRTRQRVQQGREDAAWNQLQALQDQGVYQGATGLSQPGMQALAAGGTAYGSGEQAIRDATGDYAREAQRMGMDNGGGYNPQAGITKRGATPLELEKALGGVAVAQRDTRGMRDSMTRQRQLEEDELIANAQVNEDTIKYINGNHQSLTIGDPDKKGFRQISFVKLDGKAGFERLNVADQKKLAAAQALWDRNPERAMKMVAEVNGELANVLAAEARQGEAATRISNDAASHSQTAQYHDAQLGELSRHNQAVEANNRARLGLEAAKANRENAALRKLEEGDALGREAAGYAEGLQRARNFGAEGRDAANIYGERLAGVQARMRGLGLNPGTDRERMTPKDEMAARAQLKTAGYSDEQIESMVTGYDPIKAMAQMLQERKGPAAPRTQAPAPQAAPAPRFDPAARAREIQAALAVDDSIKSGGLSGMGGRAIQAGTLPLGMGARRDLELELRQLTGGR